MNAADMLAPAMTVGEVRESLDTTQKGQTANTIANCKTVFQCDPLLKGAVRFNLVQPCGVRHGVQQGGHPFHFQERDGDKGMRI